MKKIFLTIAFLITNVLLYSQAPTFEWAKNMGGYFGFPVNSEIVVDGSGNTYNAGWFQGRVDFDPGPGLFFLNAGNTQKSFITKTDPSGNFIWAKQYGGNEINSIAVNSSNNIFITGIFHDTVDMDPGPGFSNLISAGDEDIFVARLNSSGDLIWARQFGGIKDDVAFSIAIDASDNVYTTGFFMGSVDFDPGPGNFNLTTLMPANNAFISKLNSGGNFVFAKNLAGEGSYGNSITLHSSGSIYIAGDFSGTTDFDTDSTTFNLTCSGSFDIFVAKFNINGSLQWAKQIGGTEHEQAFSIKTDVSGNVYTTGYFEDTVDFDPGPLVNNLQATANDDIFISKLDSLGNYIYAYNFGPGTGSSVYLDGSGDVYLTGQFAGTVDFDPGAGTYNITASDEDAFILKLDYTGNFVLAKSFGGASAEVTGISITVDVSGNIYTTGAFTKMCDFDPGPGVCNLVALYTNYMFTSKLDTSGNFVWANSFGESSSTTIKSMTTDPAGNVYTTGYFYGVVDFDPGPGIVSLSTAPTDLEGDVFVTKCNPSGDLLWAKQFGGLGYDFASSIAVDAAGNVYTTGTFKGTVDFNPGPAVYNLTVTAPGSEIFVSKLNASGKFIWAKIIGDSIGYEEVFTTTLDLTGNLIIGGRSFISPFGTQIFLIKLNPNGNLAWSKIYGGVSVEQANGVTSDANGNVYITGIFTDTVDFDPGAGIYNLIAQPSNYDAFVSKFDAGGNFMWAKQYSGAGLDHGTTLKTDTSGNVIIAGYFEQTVDFDPGPGIYNLTASGFNDVFITKIDSAGDFIWAQQIGGTGPNFVYSIAIDDPGNIYTTGVFYNANTDFDPGPGVFNLTSICCGDDGFISKLDASGNFIWAQLIGSTREKVYSIALDASTNIYTSGTFIATSDFDPGAGVTNLVATGYPDMYIQKLNQCSAPQALITPSGPTSFCLGDSVTLNANTSAGLTYQWKRNGVPIAGGSNSVYVATAPGNYSVFITNSQPCTAASNIIHVKVPCIPIDPPQQRIGQFTEPAQDEIKVFPNPTAGKFAIDSPGGHMQIFDAYGKLIYNSYVEKSENTFDISTLTDGIYILTLNTANSVLTKKIILNR